MDLSDVHRLYQEASNFPGIPIRSLHAKSTTVIALMRGIRQDVARLENTHSTTVDASKVRWSSD